MRLLYCVMALALTGCALEGVALPPGDDLTREPDYRTIVAAGIGAIVGDPNKVGATEISGARRTEAFKGPAWLVCVKSYISQQAIFSQQSNISQPANISQQPRYHAAFIQNDKLIESRFAVTIDQCEAQSYTPFDWRPKPVADRDRKSEWGRR
jgi:hypothetical protein